MNNIELELTELLAEVRALSSAAGVVEKKIVSTIATLHIARAQSSAPINSTATANGLVGQKTFNPDAMPTPSPRDGRALRAPSDKQLSFIDSLTEDKFVMVTRPLKSMLEASYTIDQLKSQPDVPEDQRPPQYQKSLHRAPGTEPEPEKTVSPESRLDFGAMSMIQNGRYAVTSNDGKQTAFIRVKTDKKTQARVVQGKSSDVWVKLQTYYPSGQVHGRGQWQGTPISELLTQIMLDREECADRYGARFSECVNCGRELTDDKSRYYRLGSECITKRLDLVEYVNEKSGEWFPGAASRD